MTLHDELRESFRSALTALGVQDIDAALDLVKPSGDAKNGDYQANFAMPLAKKLNRKPPELAKEIVERWGDSPLATALATATVAGPGFINLKVRDEVLAQRIGAMAGDERLGVAPAKDPQRFVIDLSGPNVAKPLHVGHLRSTIIGDSLVRLLRFLGHTVIGDNHLGDWGTQFGILIHGYKHHLDRAAYDADPVRELARLYVHVRNLAKVKDDEDETATNEIMDACRLETAKLHAGDAENLALWQQFMPHCLDMLKPIYARMDVQIDHALGESFYNPMLPGVVEELLTKGIAVESNGAIVVPNAKGIVPTANEMEKEEPPALVRKRDGAFTYTTTDLATIKYRAETWHPDAMLYCVDARQALHFKTLFANAKRWGYDAVDFRHISFGSIIGPDRRPLRTRDGGVPELTDLLDQAVATAAKKYEASVAERKEFGHDVPELDEATKQAIAEIVGIGAVKYADLSGNRTSDYVFDLERMLATEGNTATYMQYAYARCRSILRKGEVDESMLFGTPNLTEPTERALALQLIRFPEALRAAASEYFPHLITAYLWDLGRSFSAFFEACPVLKAESESLRKDRLILVNLVGRTIRTALGLLGIKTVERM
jgi:arginyl-tRNA synthetase